MLNTEIIKLEDKIDGIDTNWNKSLVMANLHDSQYKNRLTIINLYGKDKVTSLIDSFLNHPSFSNSTKKSYQTDVMQFFKWKYSIDSIDEITTDMIVDVNCDDGIKYMAYLKDTFPKHSTGNRKLKSLASLFQHLIDNSYDERYEQRLVKNNSFKNLKIKVTNATSYGSFTKDEIMSIIRVAEYPEDITMYKIAIECGIRENEILNLDIIRSFKLVNNQWHIKGIGKGGKEFYKPIAEELYNECSSYAFKNGGKIFNISDDTVRNRLNKYMRLIGISEQEKSNRGGLVFHSFKKNTADITWAITDGDIVAVQNACNHGSFNTTNKYYMNKQKEEDTTSLDIHQFLFGGVNLEEEIAEKVNSSYKSDVIDALNKLDDRSKMNFLKALEVVQN
ncbi:MAG: tyrosine-type recombinase/integrase [Desulfobacterales bacterium]|nr:tyrosine-type recombinase/integrase [Desulfobacterales bacterium]